MSPPPSLLTRSFLVGVLVLSTAYGASALTVKRTNQLIDGTYVPVLVVRHDGQTFVHQIGEDGLTRAILFNRAKALAWAKAKYGAMATDVTPGEGGDGMASIGDDDDDDDDDGGATG
ncbi:hypothetical protein [Tabrizicola aquatica]|uniref:hypothetical protein n=1 Tax=Tabrizicola aquatica TaxID=909926 RepID=UPI000CD022F2|nr:hypothetical protein [Tabrizicola aquatica]